MKNKKNTRTNIMIVFLIAVLIVGYRFVFMQPIDQYSDELNMEIMDRVSATIASMENVNFSTSITDDPKFNILRSIETPLIEVPVGKINPFLQ